MADKCVWPGQSGQNYTYHVYGLGFGPDPGQNGNYIFAKMVNNKWRPVYIGQGDLKNRKQAHLNNGCVKTKGATHFHCHLNNSEDTRLAEEDDLLANFPQAFAPKGCNVNPSG